MGAEEWQLRKQSEATKALLEGLKAEFGLDDPGLLADSIEGETNLLEAIDAVLNEIDETEVLISGLQEKETQFSARRRAMEGRVKSLRSLIEQAMVLSEQQRLRRPSGTLTLRRLPAEVVIVAAADIPSEFFIAQPPPPPKLDKVALRNALQIRLQQIGSHPDIADADAGEKAKLASRPGVKFSKRAETGPECPA